MTADLYDASVTSLGGDAADLHAYKSQALLDRQHRVEVRAHAAVRRPPAAAGSVRRTGVHRPGIPLQPVRAAGAGQRRRDPVVLPGPLRGHLPDLRQDRGQRTRAASAVCVADPGHGRGRGRRRHPVELREVPRGAGGRDVQRFRPQVEPESPGSSPRSRRCCPSRADARPREGQPVSGERRPPGGSSRRGGGCVVTLATVGRVVERVLGRPRRRPHRSSPRSSPRSGTSPGGLVRRASRRLGTRRLVRRGQAGGVRSDGAAQLAGAGSPTVLSCDGDALTAGVDGGQLVLGVALDPFGALLRLSLDQRGLLVGELLDPGRGLLEAVGVLGDLAAERGDGVGLCAVAVDDGLRLGAAGVGVAVSRVGQTAPGALTGLVDDPVGVARARDRTLVGVALGLGSARPWPTRRPPGQRCVAPASRPAAPAAPRPPRWPARGSTRSGRRRRRRTGRSAVSGFRRLEIGAVASSRSRWSLVTAGPASG